MSTTHEGHRTPGPQYLVAGRYRLQSRIGGGGMGTVWLARDQLLARDVAVKQVVSTEGLSDETAENVRKRAMREGRIAARLSHRNAVAMHDVALDSGEPWLVMEYLPSRSVAQILHTTRTLGPQQAAQIGAQVADAMTEAHVAGIIHRDIKPGNILITTTGRNAGLVKITDFGISRVKDDVSLTQTGVITGTPAYFAPEVARGAEPGEASDVYSLGATVYTVVEGQPPFGVDDNSLVLLHKVARAQINPMTKAGELRPVLLRMLEPNPAKRPTMSESRDLLAQVAAGPRGSVHQALTSPLTKPDGGVPVWAQRAPRPPRTHPTGTHLPVGGPSAHGRPGPTLQGPPPTLSTDPSHTTFESTSRYRPDEPGTSPAGKPSTSTTALAISILAFFVILAIVVVLLIALAG
ncbi:serine/threonine-protein kinase [Gordonia hankookensis]|uniref:non-specific serine/threonine protein kinase n=1 Tax=Gordonia hankookensis TaxID=589403 RepID=A0ABR7WDY2_9ACTN|nr:serine/threonine-protein kinase [Gordonia hankookensis]MBD1320992.1 serine/threonine protein kinase [Gordonia hankookensis]